MLVAMHITAPYIFMASYFMEITFFLNVSEILSYTILLWDFLVESKVGSLLVWRSEKSKFLQDTYQHMYVCIYTELFKPAIFDRD